MSASKNTYAASRAKATGTISTDSSSIIFWILASFTGLFLFWAPFQRALFNGGSYDFERSIYSASIWSSTILVLVGIYAIFRFKLQEQSDLLTILVLLLPLTYIVSLSNAASHYLAINKVYIQLLYATFFILGIFLTKNKRGTSIAAGLLMVSGYLVVMFGLLYWLGNGNFAGHLVGWFAIMDAANPLVYRDAIMTDANGLRLTSVFQYANTYAAFLMAFILSGLFFIVKSRKWLSILPHALLMVPMIVSFWLTLSRGALVILPVVFLIILFFLSFSRQILSLIQLALAFAASLLILEKITDIGTQLQTKPSAALSWNGWWVLLSASIVFAVISIAIQLFLAPALERFAERFKERRWLQFALPVAAIVLGILGAILLFGDTGVKNILPENVKTRIENINFQQHSVLERGTFYMDAIKLWKDYPVIGAGGGAWAALYEKYQNNPYTSRQAHNFALQYLVEAGALGFLVFVLFVVAVFYFYIRSYVRSNTEARDQHFLFFIITVSLLVHSMIDFDLSYVYMGAVLFLTLGLMVVKDSSKPLSIKIGAVQKVYPSVLIVIAVVVFYLTAQNVSANSSYNQALEVAKTSKDYNTIVAPLDKAISLHPAHPDYLLTGQLSRIGILLQVSNQLKTQDAKKSDEFFNQAQSLLDQLAAKEPHNRMVVLEQIYMYQQKGKQQEALDLARSQISNYPWYIDLYEKTAALDIEMSNQFREKKDLNETNKLMNDVLNTYNEVLQRVESLKNLPKGQLQGREFAVTPALAVNVGQVYFMRGDYVTAADTMKPLITDQLDDQTMRVLVRWYLAALQKQGV
ncbi:O-antigen ligase family protein [Paenibacillus hexagrammi]|uniref:O-antigen ligase family protein n=1 Tax=Paenibacillus hexagrammi TaxID=2908839 RepID=A0ABY3SMF0_9BACL|nr:O-antigen ligase family protein [Paenibacillus sp. YPD9-1]UJF34261.1 O-antigen ligase family protein [Paenibacillus sp. YPD9-1]